MKSTMTLLVSLITAINATVLVADELAVTEVEIANLGIELSSPKSADGVSALTSRARVVLPPDGEYVATAPEAGQLARLHVAVGDEVVAGQALAEVRSPAFLMQQREFLAAVFDHTLANSQLRRDQQLFDEGIIAQRRLQETESKAQTAAAHLNESRQLLRFTGMDDAAIDALAASQRFSGTLTIRAPMDAVVTERLAVAGEKVDALAPLYRIVDLSTLWLEIRIAQERLEAIRPGMTVVVAGHDGVIAKIIAVGRSVDPQTQTAVARATVVDSDGTIRPGQFLSVHIVTPSTDANAVYSIPLRAVVRSGTASYVFVRTDHGFEVRAVHLLGTQRDRAYVDQAVDPDMQIAVTGISALKALWSSQLELDP